MKTVFVKDAKGAILGKCHPARARILSKAGRATWAACTQATIQMLTTKPEATPPNKEESL